MRPLKLKKAYGPSMSKSDRACISFIGLHLTAMETDKKT